ncbi:GerMN domain-containing protein [Arthrobacter sp. NPDC090010]|uniref:GerMN domain-containing protein n=1 Tax=Arthrobacter sp. NPDC090010 TaxID=3363942 RepID=UPI0037FAF340
MTTPSHSSVRPRRRLVRWLQLAALPLVLSACTATPSSTVSSGLPEPSTLASSVPEVTSTASESAEAGTQAQVYWIGQTGGNAYLFSETRKIDKSNDPVTSALRVMMSEKPLDPDYFTAWQPPQRLAASITDTAGITVDVSSDAFSKNLDPSMAKRAVQQLVFTAVSAARASGMVDSVIEPNVTVLVDGRNDVKAFGSISLAAPFHRDTAYLSPLRLTDLQEGASLHSGQVTFRGIVLGKGTEVHWTVNRVDGSSNETSFAKGLTSVTAQEQGVGQFAVTVQLPPGKYELIAGITGPGTAPDIQDSKTVVVG